MSTLRLAALVLAAAFASASAYAATHVVAMDGVSYQPATIKVKRGDTVVWRNDDPFPHTVTSEGRFDSGSIAAGKQWKLVAGNAGTFPYTCTFHPNMQGVLVVEN